LPQVFGFLWLFAAKHSPKNKTLAVTLRSRLLEISSQAAAFYWAHIVLADLLGQGFFLVKI
jgi:hypothetical protein